MVSEFERTCKYNDMLFEIEEVITNYCGDKYSAEHVDYAISVMEDVYECRKDCDVTITDLCNAALDALCDGEYLSKINLDEKTVEVVYDVFEHVKTCLTSV